MDLLRWFVVAEVVCSAEATRPDTYDALWPACRYVTYMQTNYSALQNIQSKNIGIRCMETTHGLVTSKKICQNQSLLRKAQACGGTVLFLVDSDTETAVFHRGPCFQAPRWTFNQPSLVICA